MTNIIILRKLITLSASALLTFSPLTVKINAAAPDDTVVKEVHIHSAVKSFASLKEGEESEPRWMTWYGQYNNPYEVIGSGNMQNNGCVPTCAAMLLSAYGIGVSPTDMGYYLYDTGNFNNYYGHGGSDLCWFDVAAYAGITAYSIGDYDTFKSALLSGQIVACHIYYGGGTHAVLATGYKNGLTCVYDPIGGTYWNNAENLWNGRSFVWNDCLSGSSIIGLY